MRASGHPQPSEDRAAAKQATGDIARLARQRRWQEALLEFDCSLARRVRLDARLAAAAVSAGGRCDKWTSSISLLRLLHHSAVRADAAPHDLAVGASARRSAWQPSARLLDQLRHSSLRCGQLTYNAAIPGTLDARRWASAQALLTEMDASSLQADRISIGSTLGAAEKASRWRACGVLLSAAHVAAVLVDAVVHQVAMSLWVAAAVWRRAAFALQPMLAAALRPEVVAFNTHCTAGGVSRRWQPALENLQAVQSFALESDAISFSAAAATSEAAGRWQSALHMREHCLQEAAAVTAGASGGGIFVLNAVLKAWGGGTRWASMLAQLATAVLQGLQIDRVSFATAISAFDSLDAAAATEGAAWRYASRLLTVMALRRLEAHLLATNAAMSSRKQACGSWRTLLEMLQLSHCMDELSYATLLTSLGASGSWRLALYFIRDMMNDDMSPEASEFESVLDALYLATAQRQSTSPGIGVRAAAPAVLQDLADRSLELAHRLRPRAII
eukprot:TRINITY_DN42127_c0_g1_i1.p1 TRINITY_DN42127_c0_g1~~TRINITY_DN42127_c0_g1_i1.p1  ORF type:complete len:503 (-),score=114.58 TRINITY_DN42127_c0_g1_i1:6-1514(-)